MLICISHNEQQKKKQDIKNYSVAICHREFHHVTMRNAEKHICSSVI